MNFPASLLGPALTLLAGVSPMEAEPPVIDGSASPQLIEASNVYHCGEDRAEISYRQEKRNPHAVPLREARRVDLIRLSVPGRRIVSADLDKARQVFQSYVTIESIELRCFRRGLDLAVRGMPRREWVAFLERVRPESPQETTQTIRISKDGAVTVTQ